MAFMTPYWATVVLFAVLAIASWIALAICYEEDVKPRILRAIIRGGIVLSILALVSGFLGIWIPFFIPGLY